MEDKDKLKENQTLKKIIGTLGYGVIINFVILTLLDSFSKTDECINRVGEGPCTIYPFLLIFSLFLGWVVSTIFIKIESKNK